MACEHKRVKSVNCVIFCMDCGAMLPAQCATGGQQEKKSAKKTVKKGDTKNDQDHR